MLQSSSPSLCDYSGSLSPVWLLPPLQPTPVSQTLTSGPLVALISPPAEGSGGVWVYEGSFMGGLFGLIITEKPYCGEPRAVSGPLGSWRLLTSALTGRQQIARALVGLG